MELNVFAGGVKEEQKTWLLNTEGQQMYDLISNRTYIHVCLTLRSRRLFDTKAGICLMVRKACRRSGIRK